MRRILFSLVLISTVVGAGAFASRAYFSDTETSTGNVFAAGAIDLQVDNESYMTDANGVLVASTNTSWELSDLTDQLFFNFQDVKPGDIGEDTISLHVNDNNAWICAAARVTEDSDVNYNEPELADDTTVDQNNPLTTDGELAENLNFAFWGDDGDNVYEVGENIFVNGPASSLGAGQIALADSSSNVWGTSGPVTGGSTVYIAKAWCFGDLTPAAVAQDGNGKTGTNGPTSERGTGFTCSGASSFNNAAQTDRVMGDLQFYAVQSRNNANFTCSLNYTPVWPTPSPSVTPTPTNTPIPTNTPTPTPTDIPTPTPTISGPSGPQ